MNLRRGSTSSPISVEKISSASTASSMRTCKQHASFRIHRGFPELLRIHLAQTFVALNILALFAALHDVRENFGERL